MQVFESFIRRCGYGLAHWLMVLVTLVWAQPAWAQQPARLPNEANGLFQWVIVVLIAVLFGAVVFMNPKRTHQE